MAIINTVYGLLFVDNLVGVTANSEQRTASFDTYEQLLTTP